MEKGRTDDYAKHVKMAECLTELTVPAQSFNMIVVKDDKIKEKVEAVFDAHRLNFPPPYVNIQKWF